MRLSSFFLPLLKEAPAEAQVISHRLMLRAGFIMQTVAGVYCWLPMGLRVLKNIAQIIHEEQVAIGAQEVLMSTIQPASLWQESGRYDAYGPEMLRLVDRRDRQLLYGPTNEEQITDLFRRHVQSYRQLPQLLYQIQWKFRDEIRPRFGVMRGREFYMKDGYSFDVTCEDAKVTYEKVFQSYLKTFRRMGLTAIPVQADTGPIGGNLSHEFHVLAQTGESTLYYDACIDDICPDDPMASKKLQMAYAVAEEKYDAATCPVPSDQLKTSRGIEVGHIFYFGTKYSASMKASVIGSDGQPFYPEMGSYGIGVSRLVAAAIEAHHDDAGMVWPEAIAPFLVGLINICPGDPKVTNCADLIYHDLVQQKVQVLYDDTDARAGAKMACMDLLGLPWQIILGHRGVEHQEFEIKHRRTGKKFYIPFSALESGWDKIHQTLAHQIGGC